MLVSTCVCAQVSTEAQADAARGASLVTNRAVSVCVLCHAMPSVPAIQSGTIGPNLSGVGARWSAPQLREHLVAPERFNSNTVMPSVSRIDGFVRLAAARRGQAVLTEAQIDDVVAYLVTLK